MAFISRFLAKRVRLLAETGLRRGASGNGIWLAFGVVISGLRLVHRLGKRSRDVVFTEVLKPGEAFNITHSLVDRKGRATN